LEKIKFPVNSPEEVSLDKVKSDRRELDRIVMGEILGLSDGDQLEIYRAVIDLVKSRIEKANSF
jgi:tRNA(Ser,Leu) C12 N-acetylase TAN1